MLKILVSSPVKEHVEKLCESIAAMTDEVLSAGSSRIGPAPDMLSFIRDRHRMSIFVKADDPADIDNVIKTIDERKDSTPLLRA